MDVIAHHAEAEEVDPELPGQELHPILDPLLAVILVFARSLVSAAQKRAANAAVDAVIDADVRRIDQKPPTGAGHDMAPARQNGWKHAENTCESP
jgi:hypothetical protein